MGEEVAVRAHGAGPQVGADELAQGLLLVRASAIKMVRFQLAMQRCDRRLALETVDDLVDLDRQIEHFLGGIPARPLRALERDLEAERQALAREKFTLAAGITARSPQIARRNAEETALIPAEARLGPAEHPPETAAPDERRLSSRLLAAGLTLALLAVALAAFYLVGAGAGFGPGAG